MAKLKKFMLVATFLFGGVVIPYTNGLGDSVKGVTLDNHGTRDSVIVTPDGNGMGG